MRGDIKIVVDEQKIYSAEQRDSELTIDALMKVGDPIRYSFNSMFSSFNNLSPGLCSLSYTST